MLTRNIQGDESTTPVSPWTLPALVAGLGLFLVLMFGINNHVGLNDRDDWKATRTRPSIVAEKGMPVSPRADAINNMGRAVGDEMMTRFVVPFEVAGLLLTAALVGAIAVAFRHGDEETPKIGGSATIPLGATTQQNLGQGGLVATRTEALSTTTPR
jgi:NADH-quinone oxidoreductase subunit J